MNDITLIVNFHREGHLAKVAAMSAYKAAEMARAAGIAVRLAAVLDRPNSLTQAALVSTAHLWDRVEECDFGDLGLSRNFAVELVQTPFMAFMDGDDLCGEQWLARAWSFSKEAGVPRAFVHPEWIFYFDERDLLNQSLTAAPLPSAKSFFMRQVSSTDDYFSLDLLRFNNVYTSNQFGPTDLYCEFPFAGVDRSRGFGIEDWTWNAHTLASGIAHLVVPGTTHLVRVKETGSLGRENARIGLLPDIRSVLSSQRTSP